MHLSLHAPDWPEGLLPDPTRATPAGRGVGGRHYLRLHQEGPWGASLFVKVFPGPDPGPARREFRAGRRLLAAGGPTPRPWAVLDGGDQVWLLLEDLGPEAHLDAPAVTASAPFLAAVGQAAAALHRTGLAHGDLHLGNLLRAPDGRLLWVDLRRLHRPRRRREAARLADLGRLVASLEPLPARALLTLTGAWLAALAGAPAAAAARKALAREVAAAGDRRLREHHANLDRRARREALAGLFRDGGHPALWREELVPWRAELEAAAAAAPALKEGDRSRVASCSLPDGRQVVVKHYRRRRAGDPRDRLGRSKALTSLLAAEALARRGFRTARPLAAWSRPGAGSWLVLEDLAHLPPLHEALAATGGRQRRELLRELGGTLRRLHRLGVAYRDLKPENVLVDAGAPPGRRLVFLDHDRNRFRRRELPPEVARRDLAAVHAGLPPAVRASERLLALCHYDPRWRRRDFWRQQVRPLLEEAARRRHRWLPRQLLGGTP